MATQIDYNSLYKTVLASNLRVNKTVLASNLRMNKTVLASNVRVKKLVPCSEYKLASEQDNTRASNLRMNYSDTELKCRFTISIQTQLDTACARHH